MLAGKGTSSDWAALRFSVMETLGQNRKSCLLLSVVMAVFTVFHVFIQENLFFRETTIRYTIADGYVLMANLFSKYIFIFPIYLLMVQVFLKNDSQIQLVLRNRSRTMIWKWDCMKIVMVSAHVSMLETVLLMGLGMIRHQRTINWSEKRSVFWAQTGTSLTERRPLFDVVVMFLVTTVITCILIGMAYLTVKEVFKNTVMAYIICLCWGIIEYHSQIRFVLNRMSIQFGDWLHKDYSWVFYSLVCTAVFSFISRELVKRREYY